MNKGLFGALVLVVLFVVSWLIAASDNKTYVVNYTTFQYNPQTDELVERQTKSCKVTIDGQNSISGKRSKIESQDILFETWDYELSTSSIIVDSIDINVIQRVD
jgi:hypothetical protein